ncbi:helix-turn-helix domain-containing protein [Azospirillum soli]|uniref:helix-turn-helix domain-containing protein n=1 Tax=Azospirillum soli TaxID=1304799 RepID=UPI001AE499E9|nr:helix-turn-helix transcriptional regulator [Azospirillum soli]MBP2316803.1 transcriptional regulator with XRE-family HTH domain [Azospirillum soli]
MAPPNEDYRIAERRLRLGLTQTQVGALVGCGQAGVSRAERGQMSRKTIQRIHQALRAAEQQRERVEWAEAEAFWRALDGAPHRDRIISRIEAVAQVLLARSLADAGLGQRLLDCLPASVRHKALISAAGPSRGVSSGDAPSARPPDA